MLKVGLTGGIGAGKSEVSRLLVECGAVLIDADRIAREVVEPGTPGLAAVVDAFGTEVLTEDGRLDRPKLGSVVFADPERLAVLNSIVHPLVGARSRELEEAAAEDAVVVHDVPLLTENGLAPLYDLVIVVDASPVPSCVATTVTPGSTAPVSSVTLPTMTPVSICAEAVGTNPKVRRTTSEQSSRRLGDICSSRNVWATVGSLLWLLVFGCWFLVVSC